MFCITYPQKILQKMLQEATAVKIEVDFSPHYCSVNRPFEAGAPNSGVQSVDWLESIHQGNQLEINKTVQNQTGPSLRGKSSPSTNLAGGTTRGEWSFASGCSAKIRPE